MFTRVSEKFIRSVLQRRSTSANLTQKEKRREEEKHLKKKTNRNSLHLRRLKRGGSVLALKRLARTFVVRKCLCEGVVFNVTMKDVQTNEKKFPLFSLSLSGRIDINITPRSFVSSELTPPSSIHNALSLVIRINSINYITGN